MEIEGFPIQEKVLDEIGDELKQKIKIVSEKIYNLAGEQFNIQSPKQVADILFNKLELGGNKTNSTSVEVLKSLSNKHPIVNEILEYRKYQKLISSYIDGLKVFQ